MKIRGVLLSLLSNVHLLIFPESKESVFLKNISNNELFEILNKNKKYYLKKEINIGLKKYTIYAVFNYKNSLIKEMITQMKFMGKIYYANIFGFFMARRIFHYLKNEKNFDFNHDLIIINVPVHKKRKIERGFDQCEIICESILNNLRRNNLKIIYLKYMIKKIYDTDKQSWKKRADRQKNVLGVFELNQKQKFYLFNKSIILIDDLVTTGFTLSEIIKILEREKPKEIFIFTVAK